jgi:hypothetical protein
MPLRDAAAVAEHPNGPEVWAGLLTELAAELRQVEQPRGGTQQVGDAASGRELQPNGKRR